MSREARVFPRSTPEAEGIPSAAIVDFIDGLEQHAHALDAAHSLMLLRHGAVVAEGWWAPYRSELPHMLYSLSKSFTSSAIGIAVTDGLLGLDDLVLSFFPDDAPANPSDHLQAMTVRHLLTMNTGHHEDTLNAVWGGPDDNWPRAFLSLPVELQPGNWFVYNTPATYMLSAIITQITGEPLIDYLRPRLFDPLGIEHPTWDTDAQGRSVGGSGLHITTEDIARFGQMYLQEGVWDGQRILSEAWIEDATSAHSDNSNTQTNPDWTAGYGYQFWRNRPGGFRGDGAFGQFCIVLPDHDVVLAMTGGVRDMQRVLDLVWTHLLPAFVDGQLTADPAAQSALTERLASLMLPPVEGAPSSAMAGQISGTVYDIETNDLGIDRIRFAFDPESVTITTWNAAAEHVIVGGYDAWLDGTSNGRGVGTESVAVNGAWTGDDTFELRVCYIESEVCLILRSRFSGSDIDLELDFNVTWSESTVTTLTGHAKA